MYFLLTLLIVLFIVAILTGIILTFIAEDKKTRVITGIVLLCFCPIAFLVGLGLLGGIGGGAIGGLIAICFFLSGISILVFGLATSNEYRPGALEKERMKLHKEKL